MMTSKRVIDNIGIRLLGHQLRTQRRHAGLARRCTNVLIALKPDHQGSTARYVKQLRERHIVQRHSPKIEVFFQAPRSHHPGAELRARGADLTSRS